mmetsp:Transcript_35481/g.75765  ORF Transcript_35481/g.75765 Transcript_35481/m.75765 type:complete len:700 (+) Transcript_35481:584-2683(+)|eukprot:CAMPEP_0172547720 /NCGR_PEP_ID=MMETSP1067-20121228/17182_1 /TAXON_ID=265564 ORGANISM="Thalassiosira punctigera, Strain Tpunct2005C2" /NCGR_SAMPLE_ID=MMETSP1067 /ASSEMBLY_ACC=CAM_ASM_000444 /LENGTH=699 /DNA_ID=CAMNT_0013334849 /DNA_START=574 /DNA_END=2673 /DNA_ORIENTATION=+
MEGGGNVPHPSVTASKQEDDSSTSGYEPRILPSMPSEGNDPPDSPPAAPQAALSPYDQIPPGFEQPSDYDVQPATDSSTGKILPTMPLEDKVSPDSPPEPPASQVAPPPHDQMTAVFQRTSGFDVQPPATYAQTEPRGLRTGGVLPSMPAEPSEPQDLPLPISQTSPSPHCEKTDQLSGYAQPQAHHAQMEPGEHAGRILPSMPSQAQAIDAPDPLPGPPATQSAPSPYTQMPPGFEQAPGYDMEPPTTYAPTEPGGLSSGRILPSMPSQGSDSPDSPLGPPPPQAFPSPFDQMQPGFAQTQGYVQQPIATFPQMEMGGLSAGANVPPSSNALVVHPSYSTASTGVGTYSNLGPSTANMHPVQPYPNASYQSQYGYNPQYSMSAPMYSSHLAVRSQNGYPASQNYAGVEANSVYSGAAQAYPHYGGGYSQQYPTTASYDYHGLPSRGQARYQGNRSYAARPGKIYSRGGNRSGPDNANLFIFHIPNEMTNASLARLFEPYGNVISARIMAEADTGRGQGYGFVSYDSAESAARAIHFLNHFQILGKRLKVEYKRRNQRNQGQTNRDDETRNQGRFSLPANLVPVQERTRTSKPHQHHPSQSPAGFVPVQDYAGSSEPLSQHEATPLLPSIDEPHHHREPTPTLPLIDEPHHSRQPTPTLPPIDTLQDGSEPGQGAKSNTTSPSPLADLKDIEKSLPDPK